MKKWFKFAKNNKRMLNFGFLFNFFSSFGQTFFLSLFVPFWLGMTGINNAAFAGIYAAITVAAAFSLSLTGKYIDKLSLKTFGLVVFSGLTVAVVILSLSNDLVTLVAGLFLARWFGQGLMAHTSAAGVAKHFNRSRGKALGLTSLGHPAGQFVFPLIVVPLVAAAGWRQGLFALAALAALVVFPSLWAVRRIGGFEPDVARSSASASDDKVNYFKQPKFWLIAANAFVVPFICTAIFLYQYVFGPGKGWDPAWIAFSFTFYAIFNAIALLVSGYLIDTYSARSLFPIYLLPAGLALALLAVTDQKWAAPLFYALLGLSTGLGSIIKTAVQVEIFGSGRLGKIRSYLTAVLILGTALGPLFFGFLLDREVPFRYIMAGSVLLVFLASAVSFKLWDKKLAD